jgi:gamma-glutamyl-gamma-aminobutyrate hydrolase PuuD
VGVTTYRQQAAWGPWDRLAEVLPASYAECVAAAGGRPLLLPPCDGPGGGDDTARSVVDALDALVLVGGGDIDPARYGQAPHPATAGIDPARDANEFALLREALDTELPVLAICRGMQVLNVALGGTLVQHVPDVVGHEGHQPARGCFGPIQVTTEPGSLVAKIVGDAVTVSCSHHQSVDGVGAGLSVVARARDAIVEAVELPTSRFVVGVEWHPEEDGDPRLFDALMDATR